MKNMKLVERNCRQVLARLDSYIDNQLVTETTLDLLDHLRRCAPCMREADERRNARVRLRTAVRRVEIPEGLESRVRERLRESRQPNPRKVYFMAIAAAVLVGFAFWLRLHPAAGPMPAVMRTGYDQHLHCAVVRQRNNRPSLPINKLSAQYAGLIPIVQRYAPVNLPLSIAHECSHEGRKFVHLTFRDGGRLLSLVIAKKRDGESLQTAAWWPALRAAGIPMYANAEGSYQIAGFEVGSFLVYTVSELPRDKNLGVLVALAPSLYHFLQQIPS